MKSAQPSPLHSSPNARQLEILCDSAEGGVKGSLIWLLDHTRTAFGRRQLRRWVTHPLRQREAIEARLDAVDELRSQGSRVREGCG